MAENQNCRTACSGSLLYRISIKFPQKLTGYLEITFMILCEFGFIMNKYVSKVEKNQQLLMKYSAQYFKKMRSIL
jgi:hypothetical protein